MHRVKRDKLVNKSLPQKVLAKIGVLLLQLAVMLTFLGIVPVIILLYISIYKELYLDTIFLCGALLTLIKSNKMIQG